MYAGFYANKRSASWLGAHQKFNRAAHTVIKDMLGDDLRGVPAKKLLSRFPDVKQINKYEGYNGPDGIKVKSPAQDEPWHYYDPFDDDDDQIFNLITAHFQNLVTSLADRNYEKAAFEASWLSHTITDGLTPAHHYPYEKEMEDTIGRKNSERTTKSKKLIAKGDGLLDTIKRNWQIHGGKGVLTTHIHFEAGITSAILTHRIKGARPSDIELDFTREHGLIESFKRNAEQIARLNLYGSFFTLGWGRRMAKKVRSDLAPLIVKTVAMAWYLALEEATQQA